MKIAILVCPDCTRGVNPADIPEWRNATYYLDKFSNPPRVVHVSYCPHMADDKESWSITIPKKSE